jgi:Fic family protein
MNNDLDLFLAEIDLLKSQLELQIHYLDQDLQQRLDIQYCFEDNQIENGSLSLAEITLLVRNGLISPDKPMAESLAVLNHSQAIQFVREQAADQALLSEPMLKQLHGILTRAIDREHAGAYRTQAAVIAGCNQQAPAPKQLADLMHSAIEELRLEGPFMHPVLYAAETHLRLIQLQPFNSANGRCARLAMNLILLAEGYPLTIIPASSRQLYHQALDLASSNDKSYWQKLIAEQVMSNTQALMAQLDQAEASVQ